MIHLNVVFNWLILITILHHEAGLTMIAENYVGLPIEWEKTEGLQLVKK